jgi:hypothetical protein
LRENAAGEEYRLVRRPDEILTPLLLEAIRSGTEERPVALFFDTWEHTASFLDDWLQVLS